MALSANALGVLEQPRKQILASSGLQLIAEIEKEGLTCAPLLALLLSLIVNVYSASGKTNGMLKYSDQLNINCRPSVGCSLEASSLMGEAATHLNK